MERLMCLVLGDQLSVNISSLQAIDKSRDIILMCEVWNEASYVKHHKKKICFLFSAMRHFAQSLVREGWSVDYQTLAPEKGSSFSSAVEQAVRRHKVSRLVVTMPGEYRVWDEIRSWKSDLGIEVEIVEDTRFICSLDEFKEWAKGRKQLRMEYFYRTLRKKMGVLIENGKPTGGKWNYDTDNRKSPNKNLKPPDPLGFEPDEITQNVIKLVDQHFYDHFGDLEPFKLAVDREQALQVLDHFIEHRLPLFGDYQDAMIQGQPWMYHSVISFYLNAGLLNPREVVEQAIHAFERGHAPLNAVEGFVRQVIGWREFIRGIYWLFMPEYKSMNALSATRNLPSFYWTGDTDMNCLKQCVQDTRRNAYAHHIQRLMVLGNFALLAGVHPDEVNEWYLVVYADAYEWVELPNVTGMVLFADGGIVASKPYAASGAYINKMSDYCTDCSYEVAEKVGSEACPFNYLYWDFLMRNKEKLASNSRLTMIYKSLARMTDEKQKKIQESAASFLQELQ